jgi:hypothetical protein
MHTGLLIVLCSIGAQGTGDDVGPAPAAYQAAPRSIAWDPCKHCYHTPYGRYYQGCYDFRREFDYPWKTTPYWSLNVAAFRGAPVPREEILAPHPDPSAAPTRADSHTSAQRHGARAAHAPVVEPGDRPAPELLPVPDAVDAPAIDRARGAAPRKSRGENSTTSH